MQTDAKKREFPRIDSLVALDFEMGINKKLYHIGAVFNTKTFQRNDIENEARAIRDLSVFADRADYLLGHNIARHDLPAAKAIWPDASFLSLPVIDTLFLSPLAFPENPYHKLIKDYKLVKTGKNDPLADAKLALSVFTDQVDNLNRATGREAAAAVNGSLTLPERGAVMEKVRLGDIGILYISPEQLRNYSVAQLIRSRDVGCWVFDEAHCLSKWGHDFRPDYLHVSEFIAGYSDTMARPALVGAFTATAKKDVVDEIVSHCKETLCLDLAGFTGGVERDNLTFQVWPVTANEKQDVILTTLAETLGQNSGGAIVYCASRKETQKLSDFLNERGIAAQAFHAGKSEPEKRNIQDDFIGGTIPVICATNAFGMGIDKKDIRLVIHADIPGSLENYLQEAGRAGRDMAPSECVLLYEAGDIENQFSLNAFSKLSIKDIKKTGYNGFGGA